MCYVYSSVGGCGWRDDGIVAGGRIVVGGSIVVGGRW